MPGAFNEESRFVGRNKKGKRTIYARIVPIYPEPPGITENT